MNWRLLTPILFLVVSCKNTTLFEKVSSGHTHIDFTNIINDNDSLNVLDVENLYNGGGIGIGDFNNDGLQDIYFSANTVSNKLYLNKGDFEFEDVTEAAAVTGEGRWGRGISVVDINNDGLLDIYVCASLSTEVKKRENLLYVNTGIDAKGIPHFKNMASEYGLADTVHSTMAAFFDYDNDGDLDMYLLINEIIKGQYPSVFKPILKNREHPNTDKLFRNDFDAALGHAFFKDVSTEAGITIEGFGHGVNIADINRDGWKDIYVTNDFVSNNLLYINNHDGTFTDEVRTYFKHTSENSMGVDVIDINNDGLADVVEADMNPQDNYRKKMMLNPLSYQRYQNNEYYGYQHQYVRNVLQINQGPRVLENDSIGAPVFSDIAFYAGIAETDWSWTPSVADFDNDGFRDLIITNGFPKDVTDHDFATYRNRAYQIASKKDILDQIPVVKISNYAYKNNGDLTFKDVTKGWGLDLPTFSNGAAYADLDNDGDLDYVINNINEKALVFKNNGRQTDESKHYLQIQFKGDAYNRNGLGAFAEIYYGGKMQVYENTPYRGYLSSVSTMAHFGLGNISLIDSVIIRWPNGKMQLLRNVSSNQVVKADVKNAVTGYSFSSPTTASNSLFKEVSSALNITGIHKDRDFIDFNIQKLLPHKFSEYGPGIAVGDIDGNGLDDFICGGSFFYDTEIFLQQTNGQFHKKTLLGKGDSLVAKNHEDLGLLLFDADNDKDLDLYISSGGFEADHNTDVYQDHFYSNDGKGNFTQDSFALPKNFTSKFCVRSADYDKDGDLDLFVAGRVDPWHYPLPVSSFIYRNDTKNGTVKFTDVTSTAASGLLNIGLVCDAVFTDFDNDGWEDLVLAGEWMPIQFFKNKKGTFENVTLKSGINKSTGWWNSIVPGDFDNDGDVDYIVGNLGKNSFYRASSEYPVNIIAKDFDNNESFDAFLSLYLPGSSHNPVRKEYPAHLRDDMIKQMISMRARFQTYRSYATATMNDVLTDEQKKGAIKLHANEFRSCYLQNNGGNFKLFALPIQAQWSTLCGMIAEDFDGDGNLDVLISGNDFGADVSTGRYDAMNGLLIKGDGKGNFKATSILESGVFIPGNGKALVKFRNSSKKCLIAAGQNKGPYKIFELKNDIRSVVAEPLDVSAIVRYRNGKTQKREINYGSSFLSQSGRFLLLGNNVVSVEVTNSLGAKRKLSL